MLASLRIQNLALVEDLPWTLSPGFVAVTGETGSGKSIIVGALKLVLGERADKSLIRTGADQCAVEAVFRLADPSEIDALLAGQGIDPCGGGELIVKRSLSRGGTSRQFVNCCATTLAVLKTLGDALVDLHGPHDHQSLLSADHQLGLLDAFAGAADLRSGYGDAYRRLRAFEAEHAGLAAGESALERELDLLRHQVAEIEAAGVRPDEEATLEARYTVARNSRRLIELTTDLLGRLSENDDAVLGRLAETHRLFRELERVDPGTAEVVAAHAGAAAGIEEAVSSLRRYADGLDIDPASLAQIEERVNLLETLKRKYGPALSDVIAFGERAAERLRKIESRGDELARLERDIAAAKERMLELGGRLSEKRRAAAAKLGKAIKRELSDLGFKRSDFAVVTEKLAVPSASGLESVEFLFGPNPGEPPKPLRAIASSGEISRVMLAVKSALAAQDEISLLVFDEIDANVGGEIAHAVAVKMRALGAARQVLCVTHLPQVAAAAAAQFVVAKDYANGRTTSFLEPVEGDRRIAEIARMLGGKSESALAHAKTLLGSK